MKVVTETQMREIDRVTIEERGVPSLTLMERAGVVVANLIMTRFRPEHVAVCAGKGNNGGDGFVVARQLSQRGVTVDLFLAVAPDELQGDAAANFSALPAKVRYFRDPDADRLREHADEASLIVDALLGTGIRGVVHGPLAKMIDVINTMKGPVVALDIPSGLAEENLRGGGPCVRAGCTVTIGLPKLPLVVFPGVEYVGELIVADIGFPPDLLNSPDIRLNLLEAQDVRRRLPVRPPDSHKGTFGHLLVIAGSLGMGGAAAMVGHSALRTGVGLVTVASHEKCVPGLEAHLLSGLKRPLTSKKKNVLDMSALAQLEEDLDTFDAVALGPGLGRDPATQRLIRALIERIGEPLILDADGLNALADELGLLAKRTAPTILTPHPKEMSRLSGQSVGEIQSDRIAAARAFAEQHGVTLVLKGARTVVADQSGEVWINPTGNDGLAKGGSGDVLTGLIAGLAAQGMSPTDAAICGVHWHGLAADVLARRLPTRAMIPEDLIETLGESLRELLG
jgi:hydroxyethylthiazole kinase-like uncharacterized protein yjeF